ncbi:MAG: hypothetical protein CL859_09790 [Cyanobium sp. ARS6]|nr:hypothetical protein [Cyanobium sp. ARS6]
MSPQQTDCIVDLIIANNPTHAEIDAHLASAFAAVDEHNKIILHSMKLASRKRQALEDFLAYEDIHRRLIRNSYNRLTALKANLIRLHTKGIIPRAFRKGSPSPESVKLQLVHLYRHQANTHPVSLPKLLNIFLKYHKIEVEEYVSQRYLDAQSHDPLSSNTLPFSDPLSLIAAAA